MGDLGLELDKKLPGSKIKPRQEGESLEDYVNRVADQANRILDGLAQYARESRILSNLGFTEMVTEDGSVISSFDTDGQLTLASGNSGSITIDNENNSLIFTSSIPASNIIAESTGDIPESPLEGDVMHINADFDSYITGQRYQYDGTDWVRLKDRIYNTTIADGQISITIDGYVTETELSSTLNSYDTSSAVNSKIDNSLSGYATENYVDDSIPDLTGYATESYVDDAIPSLAGYATQTYVDNAIPDVSSYQQISDIIAANEISQTWNTANSTGCYMYHNGVGFWDTSTNQWMAFLGMSEVNSQKKGYFYVGTGGTAASDRYIHCYTVYEDSSYTTRVIVRVDEGFLGSSTAYFNVTDGKLYMEDDKSNYKNIIEISAAIVDAAKIRDTSTSSLRDSLLRLAPGGLSVSSKYGTGSWVMSFLMYCGDNGNTYIEGYSKTYIRNCTIESSNVVHPAALKFSGNGSVSGKFYDSGWQTGKGANTYHTFNHGLGVVPTLFFGYVRDSDDTGNIQMFASMASSDYGIMFYNVDGTALSVFIDQRATVTEGSSSIGWLAGDVDVRVIAWA